MTKVALMIAILKVELLSITPVIGGKMTIARHLMEKGANPNQMDNDGNTPLTLATKLRP